MIVYFYVNDLIFSGNNPEMIAEFREAMIKQFGMTDIGLMSYFWELRFFNMTVVFYFSEEIC